MARILAAASVKSTLNTSHSAAQGAVNSESFLNKQSDRICSRPLRHSTYMVPHGMLLRTNHFYIP